MRIRSAAALSLALVLGAAACSDDAPEAGGATTTTVADPGSTTTAAVVDETTTTAAAEATTTTAAPEETTTSAGDVGDDGPALPTNAEDYAVAFIEAWSHGDIETAEVLGTDEAVSTIFSLEGGGTWSLQGCEGAAGSSFCTFSAGGDANLVVRVLNEAASLGQPQAVSSVQLDEGATG